MPPVTNWPRRTPGRQRDGHAWSAPTGCRDHVSELDATIASTSIPASPVGPRRRGCPPRARAAFAQRPAPVRYTRSGRHRWRGPSQTRPGHTTPAAAAIVADTVIYHKRVRFNPAIRTVHRLAGSSTTCVASTPHAWPTDRPPGRTARRFGGGCGRTSARTRPAAQRLDSRCGKGEGAAGPLGLGLAVHAHRPPYGHMRRNRRVGGRVSIQVYMLPAQGPGFEVDQSQHHSRSSRRSGRNLRRGTSPLGRRDPHTVTLTWTDEFPAGATPAPGYLTYYASTPDTASPATPGPVPDRRPHGPPG
jgi:hypothetical protein